MSPHKANRGSPVALVTGAARRIGAAIARQLHSQGYRVAIHYHQSAGEAQSVCDDLNHLRPNSAAIFSADLCDTAAVRHLAQQVLEQLGRVDALVNNASSFYPTPLETASEQQWDDLMGSNLKGPYFLATTLAPELKKRQGTIVNVADIYGQQPLKNHSIYSIAKAGNRMLTKALARDLAPKVRVNGIAPGAILWPESGAESNATQAAILARIPLQHLGSPSDIATLAAFLVTKPGYLTGQIIAVDGGRSLT